MECPAAYYCPVGSKSPTECPVGFYCPYEKMSVPFACPKGDYCPDTQMEEEIPCPGGTTSAGGANGIPGSGGKAGAKARTDCYVVGGQDGTIFTDNTGKVFHLPVEENIPVK